MSSYREIWRAEQRKLPADATPQERGEATRRAAALYHGRPVRRNPSDRIVKLGILAGALLLLGPKLLQPKR